MRRGHVVPLCAVSEFARTVKVARKQLAIVKQFDHPAAPADHNPLARFFKRNAVEMVVITDMVVLSNKNIILDIRYPKRLFR
jgi:hypothetical protein